MRNYSTRDAAKKLGIAAKTLSHYIAVGKVPAPRMAITGGLTLHLWTEEEIERVRELLPKIANGRKTRYQKLRAQQEKKKGQTPKKKK